MPALGCVEQGFESIKRALEGLKRDWSEGNGLLSVRGLTLLICLASFL